MTNRMDSSPRRAPDRRCALITLSNDLKMPSVSVGVCARDARGIVSYIRQPVCVLQQFYVRHPSRAHTGAHTHAGAPTAGGTCRDWGGAGGRGQPPALNEARARTAGHRPRPRRGRGAGTVGGTVATGRELMDSTRALCAEKTYFPKHSGLFRPPQPRRPSHRDPPSKQGCSHVSQSASRGGDLVFQAVPSSLLSPPLLLNTLPHPGPQECRLPGPLTVLAGRFWALPCVHVPERPSKPLPRGRPRH